MSEYPRYKISDDLRDRINEMLHELIHEIKSCMANDEYAAMGSAAQHIETISMLIGDLNLATTIIKDLKDNR